MARNARTLAAIEDRMNEPPEEIEYTVEFEQAKLRLWDEQIADVGCFIEAISEQDDTDLTLLARIVRDNQNGAFTETIGKMVTDMVTKYCEPDNDAVIESMDKDGDR